MLTGRLNLPLAVTVAAFHLENAQGHEDELDFLLRTSIEGMPRLRARRGVNRGHARERLWRRHADHARFELLRLLEQPGGVLACRQARHDVAFIVTDIHTAGRFNAHSPGSLI